MSILRLFLMLLSMLYGTTAASAAVLPLGSFLPTDAIEPDCPAGFSCSAFEVACSEVSDAAPGFLAIAGATGTPRGLIVFFTGGSGMGWWSRNDRDLLAFTDDLRSLGFAIAQVRWATNWLESSPGNQAGTAHLGCRPATLIRHIHDTMYAPLNLSPQTGECGFCITGNSGGATQVGFALSHYGLDSILDGVFPSGGPPHSAMAKSCLGEEGYDYELDTRQFLDRGFGFFDGNGPCARRDPSFIPRWNEESVASGDNDYFHPNTRIHFLFGQTDHRQQIVGGDYVTRLRAEGTPFLNVTIVPNTPHNIRTPEGLAVLKEAILGTASSAPSRRRPARR